MPAIWQGRYLTCIAVVNYHAWPVLACPLTQLHCFFAFLEFSMQAGRGRMRHSPWAGRGFGLFHDFYFTASPSGTGLFRQWQQGIA